MWVVTCPSIIPVYSQTPRRGVGKGSHPPTCQLCVVMTRTMAGSVAMRWSSVSAAEGEGALGGAPAGSGNTWKDPKQ